MTTKNNDPKDGDQDKENNDPNNEDQKANKEAGEQEKTVFIDKAIKGLLAAVVIVAILVCIQKCYSWWSNNAGTSIAKGTGTEVVQQDTTLPITAISDPVTTPTTTPVKTEPTKTTSTVTTNSLANLRSLPNTSSAQVGQVKKGEVVNLVGISSDGMWLETSQGWIAKNLVSNYPAGLPVSDRTHSAPAGWTQTKGGKDAPGVTSTNNFRGDQ